nr:MAG TPA: hypothetical protein [Caudoviricetes sp.]
MVRHRVRMLKRMSEGLMRMVSSLGAVEVMVVGLVWSRKAAGAGRMRSVRRLMCIRCLIRGNASRWLAKGISLRAKWY